jgi:hypothetical protein
MRPRPPDQAGRPGYPLVPRPPRLVGAHAYGPPRPRGVPLGTILVTGAVLAVACLAGKRSPAGSGHHRDDCGYGFIR